MQNIVTINCEFSLPRLMKGSMNSHAVDSRATFLIFDKYASANVKRHVLNEN